MQVLPREISWCAAILVERLDRTGLAGRGANYTFKPHTGGEAEYSVSLRQFCQPRQHEQRGNHKIQVSEISGTWRKE